MGRAWLSETRPLSCWPVRLDSRASHMETLHEEIAQGAYRIHVVGNLVGLNFRYKALEAYFRGLIFIVCPEHVIM